MSDLLKYSILHRVFFPSDLSQSEQNASDLRLQRVLRHSLIQTAKIRDLPLIVFDFETTGLDSRLDRIIEIGALKIIGSRVVAEFSTLIDPEMPLPAVATKISGITSEMLKGQPKIDSVLPQFLQFISGGLLIAHNADFDMAFLSETAQRHGIDLVWPCFCTLKLARSLLPHLESKNLDTLASHYQLTFEARHRSIGDCKVTYSVLQNMLDHEGKHLMTWNDLQPFAAHSGLSA